MSDLEFTRESIARWMWADVPTYIHYWATDGEYTTVDGDDALTFTERYGTYGDERTPVTVTFSQFLEAIDTWAEQVKGHKYRYYAKFSADWIGEVWERVDYDMEVVDQIFQHAAFGKTTYA